MDPRDLELVSHVRRLGAASTVVDQLVLLMGGTSEELAAYEKAHSPISIRATATVTLTVHEPVETFGDWDLDALAAEVRWLIEEGELRDAAELLREAVYRTQDSPDMLSRVRALVEAIKLGR